MGRSLALSLRGQLSRLVSYRDLEDMLEERCVDVDHTAIYRWVRHYAPEMEKRLCWLLAGRVAGRVDETYIKIKGRWVYLYRAVTKRGDNRFTFHRRAMLARLSFKRFRLKDKNSRKSKS